MGTRALVTGWEKAHKAGAGILEDLVSTATSAGDEAVKQQDEAEPANTDSLGDGRRRAHVPRSGDGGQQGPQA